MCFDGRRAGRVVRKEGGKEGEAEERKQEGRKAVLVVIPSLSRKTGRFMV